MADINSLRKPSGLYRLIAANWSLLLILSAFFLFATSTSFNIPIYIMALAGLFRVFKNRALLRSQEIHFINILFFSLWLPMLFSLTDAADLTHALKTALPYVRFLFAAYFVIDEVKNKDLTNKLVFGIGIIITFWCLDALFQFFVGIDIFGYPMHYGSAEGLFSPKGTLGHVLVILSPVYFEIVRRNHRQHPSLWLLLLLFFGIIFLGGKRTAWLMLISSCAVYGAYLFYLYKNVSLKKILLVAPILLLSLGLLFSQYQPLNARAKTTLGLFSGNYEQIDKATSRRLSIWETGLKIYRANWINGIGPRGFRHVYADYADADNFFMVEGRSGQTHPHLTLLEIMAETGTLGLLGFLIFWSCLLRHAWQAIIQQSSGRLPWLMCIMIATLPYNAGLAFYGSYWSSIVWWVILVSTCCMFSKQNS